MRARRERSDARARALVSEGASFPAARASARSRNIGRLQPRVVLVGEEHGRRHPASSARRSAAHAAALPPARARCPPSRGRAGRGAGRRGAQRARVFAAQQQRRERARVRAPNARAARARRAPARTRRRSRPSETYQPPCVNSNALGTTSVPPAPRARHDLREHGRLADAAPAAHQELRVRRALLRRRRRRPDAARTARPAAAAGSASPRRRLAALGGRLAARRGHRGRVVPGAETAAAADACRRRPRRRLERAHRADNVERGLPHHQGAFLREAPPSSSAGETARFPLRYTGVDERAGARRARRGAR